MAQNICIKSYPLSASPSTNPFGGAGPAVAGGEIQPVPVVGGGVVHTNPPGSQVLPRLTPPGPWGNGCCCFASGSPLPSCPTDPGREGIPRGVEAGGHLSGGWAALHFLVCAKARVAGRAWGLKGCVGHILGAFREGARLRRR